MFGHLVRGLLPYFQQLPDYGHVKPGRLRLAKDVLDVGTEGLLFFVQPLDPLDEGPKPVGGDFLTGGLWVSRLAGAAGAGGSGIVEAVGAIEHTAI